MNYYAHLRITRYMDLVVEPASEQVNLLMSMFEADYYWNMLVCSSQRQPTLLSSARRRRERMAT